MTIREIVESTNKVSVFKTRTHKQFFKFFEKMYKEGYRSTNPKESIEFKEFYNWLVEDHGEKNIAVSIKPNKLYNELLNQPQVTDKVKVINLDGDTQEIEVVRPVTVNRVEFISDSTPFYTFKNYVELDNRIIYDYNSTFGRNTLINYLRT